MALLPSQPQGHATIKFRVSQRLDSDSEDNEDVRGKALQHNSSGSVREERKGVASEVSSNEAERVNGEITKRRSNTELRRLRMMEIFDVGVKGITQELVASVHQKWRDSEVAKFKFGIPLSAHMKRLIKFYRYLYLSPFIVHSYPYLYASLEFKDGRKCTLHFQSSVVLPSCHRNTFSNILFV